MKKGSKTIFANNKSATYHFTLESELEAGLVLEGWEVVSTRQGKANLSNSYVQIKNGEAWLIGCFISPLSTITIEKPDSLRPKKLLLNRKELNKLIGATAEKGKSIVPLKIYLKSGRIKLAIALAKGKKVHDKRHALKEKDIQRDQLRNLRDKG